MYKMIVGEIGKQRQENWNVKNDNPYAVWDGRPFAAEIRRLFEAERLNPAGLKNLQPEKDYAVLFLGFQMAAACA